MANCAIELLAPNVVVLAMSVLVATASGCKKKENPLEQQAPASSESAREPPVPTPSGAPTSNVVYRGRDGCLMRTPHFKGHDGPAWNTYPADCPAELLTPGEPPSKAKRPAGKENWTRLQSSLSYAPYRKSCSFTPERFCTPTAERGECTPFAPTKEPVACTYDEAHGKMTWETFVYEDAFKACHQVASGECKISRYGGCDLPSGDVVPCPPPGP